MSEKTLDRRLNDDPRLQGLKFKRVASKMGKLTDKNLKQRLLFCRYNLRKKTDFTKWGFSDESKFKMSDLTPKYQWVLKDNQ